MAYKDKRKQKKNRQDHYLKNKTVYLHKARISGKKIRDRNRKFIFDFLSIHPCVDCGLTDIRCLDFDHIEAKEFDVSKLIGYSLKRLEKEISKCEVRCSNCHRIKHWNENHK